VLDAACDPNAVFALTYMYMTYGARVFIGNHYFDDGNAMAAYTVHFATRYIDAFDAYVAGNLDDVSGPWIQTFNWAASGKSNASENLFLGMNAHINYDLAIATAESGFNTLERKPDFDRVNDLLGFVMANISLDVVQRYDPSLLPGPLDGIILPLIISWRESAWTTSTLYSLELLAPLLQGLSEVTATAAALLYQPLRLCSTSADRIAFCSAHHAPSKIN